MVMDSWRLAWYECMCWECMCWSTFVELQYSQDKYYKPASPVLQMHAAPSRTPPHTSKLPYTDIQYTHLLSHTQEDEEEALLSDPAAAAAALLAAEAAAAAAQAEDAEQAAKNAEAAKVGMITCMHIPLPCACWMLYPLQVADYGSP